MRSTGTLPLESSDMESAHRGITWKKRHHGQLSLTLPLPPLSLASHLQIQEQQQTVYGILGTVVPYSSNKVCCCWVGGWAFHPIFCCRSPCPEGKRNAELIGKKMGVICVPPAAAANCTQITRICSLQNHSSQNTWHSAMPITCASNEHLRGKPLRLFHRLPESWYPSS